MPTLASEAAASPDFAAVYREHHGFVWRTLRHLGVDPGHVDDALQDTFMVVHARLAEFEGRAALRTWLFEIARRIAARYRRVAAREAPRLCVLDEVPGPAQQDDELERAEAAEILRSFLDELDRDKSVVFILSDLEQWRAPEIAEALELNLNTVYARLRAARKQLDRVVARLQARDQRTRPHRTRRAADVVAAAVLAVPPPTSPDWPIVLGGPGAATELAFAGTASTTAGISLLKVGALATGIVGLTFAAVVGLTRGETTPSVVTPIHAAVTQSSSAPSPALQAASSPAPTPTITPRTSRAARPDRLAAELASLEAARAALIAEDPRKALGLLARHARRFPAGALAQEAAATHIEALCQLGDEAGAQREAGAYADRWPATATWTAAPCRP